MPKVKVTQKSIKDPELIDMFNNMLGEGSPDPAIVIPKYESIMLNAREILQLLEALMRSPLRASFYFDFKKGFDEIRKFIDVSGVALDALAMEKNDKILTGAELHEINSHPERIQEFMNNMQLRYKISNLGESYKNLKSSGFVKEMVMTTRNIKNSLMLEKERTKAEHHCLEVKENLTPDFIVQSDGDFLELFSFSTFDFKQLYLHETMSPEFSKYILFLMHLLYKKMSIIIREITSPDIDVDKFAEVLIRSISEVRKHIPRCDRAFDKIESSVGLLKQNFGEYYKDFISSQNPGIIIENFVSDVARNAKADLTTTNQFRRIIQYYRKSMSGKIQDPKVKKIFELVSTQLDALETEVRKKPDSDTPVSDEREESEDPTPKFEEETDE